MNWNLMSRLQKEPQCRNKDLFFPEHISTELNPGDPSPARGLLHPSDICSSSRQQRSWSSIPPHSSPPVNGPNLGQAGSVGLRAFGKASPRSKFPSPHGSWTQSDKGLTPGSSVRSSAALLVPLNTNEGRGTRLC